MWQQCPNCKGSGKEFKSLSAFTSQTCTVCDGAKIIDEITGLPPVYYQNAINTPYVQIIGEIKEKTKENKEPK